MKQISYLWHTRNFKIIVLVGLLLRLLVAPFSAYPWDVYSWYETSMGVVTGSNLYNRQFYPYPPIWLLVMAPFAYLYAHLSNIFNIHPISSEPLFQLGYPSPLIVDCLFSLLIKIPIILSDLAICILLYKMTNRLTKDPRLCKMVATAYFLNPLTIWITAFAGTFDALPVLFSLIAFASLINEKYERAGVFTGLSIAAKYYALLLIPAAFFFIKENNKRKLLNYCLFLLLPLALIILPFFSLDSNNLINALLSPAVGAKIGNLSAWSFLHLFNIYSVPWYIATLDVVVIFIIILLNYKRVNKTYQGTDLIQKFNEMVLFAFFIFYAGFRLTNEQYLIWIMPFFILYSTIPHSSAKISSPFTIVFLTSVINYNFSIFAPILTIGSMKSGALSFISFFDLKSTQMAINLLSVPLWISFVYIVLKNIKNLWKANTTTTSKEM